MYRYILTIDEYEINTIINQLTQKNITKYYFPFQNVCLFQSTNYISPLEFVNELRKIIPSRQLMLFELPKIGEAAWVVNGPTENDHWILNFVQQK